ncbi:histidine kinase [uncultured Algibacter sp.]|uniref:sensor histidine kinase n=1 Tax=uncultured Algibacter sp. TaxID=298659 RepID=UPI00262CE7E4|nr:histidine kinase [uncultured Algibacter sp.]
MIKQIKLSIERKLLLYLYGFYAVNLISSALIASYYKYNEIAFISKSWEELLSEIFVLGGIPMIIFISAIALITQFLIKKKYSWKIVIPFHIIFAFLYSSFLGLLHITLRAFIRGESISENLGYIKLVQGTIWRIDDNFTLYIAFVAIIYAYFYLSKDKENKIKQAKIEAQLIETKIKVLKSHLQPHFLFNTLNSIYTLIDSDVNSSKEMLVNLSELLRKLIDFKDLNLIELQDELNLFNKYLDIVKIRFSDDLKVDMQISDDLENVLIPSLLIQPIVENSIKHGYSKNHITLKIFIKIIRMDSKITIEILNNGRFIEKPFKELTKKGMGIINTIDRLKTLYKDQFNFEFKNTEEGVLTKITLPYRLSEYNLL